MITMMIMMMMTLFSVSMSHLAYPPLTPVSPLPHPRDQTQARLSSQNLTMYAESARIQKVRSETGYTGLSLVSTAHVISIMASDWSKYCQ